MLTKPLIIAVIVGRGLLALLVDDQVHDGYAFLLGSYAVFPVIFGLYRFRRRYKSYRARLQRRLRRRRTQKSLKPPVPWKAFLRNEIVYYSTLLSSLAILVLSGLVVLPLLAGLAFSMLSDARDIHQNGFAYRMNRNLHPCPAITFQWSVLGHQHSRVLGLRLAFWINHLRTVYLPASAGIGNAPTF